jgi:hypothetical protein
VVESPPEKYPRFGTVQTSIIDGTMGDHQNPGNNPLFDPNNAQLLYLLSGQGNTTETYYGGVTTDFGYMATYVTRFISE